jgi:hypothetical protein
MLPATRNGYARSLVVNNEKSHFERKRHQCHLLLSHCCKVERREAGYGLRSSRRLQAP